MRFPARVICIVYACSAAFAEERILSAVYGIANCIGVKDAKDWDALSQQGCNVVTVETSRGLKNMTSARSTTNMKLGCGLSSEIKNADGLPVTFTSPVDLSTLDAKDFNFTLSDGTWVQPQCVTAQPAGESNEGNTIATIGHFGDGLKGTIFPTKVSIVGDLHLKTPNGSIVNARGFEFPPAGQINFDFDYMSPRSHVHMVQARMEHFSTTGETLFNPLKRGVFPNHCQHIFGKHVTHRVRVIISGGGTVDGVNSFFPETPDVFQVMLRNGSQLAQPYLLGVADLGTELWARSREADYAHDTDNFMDLCIADPEEEAVQVVAAVRMPCNRTKLYYPKGNSLWNGCQDHHIVVEKTPI